MNKILILVTLSFSMNCCRNSEENKNVNQSQVTENHAVLFNGIDFDTDSIVNIDNFELELTESSEDEFNKYADNVFSAQPESIKGKSKIPVDIFVREVLTSPKYYLKENLFPLIDWNKKLNVFLDAERVAITTARTYNGGFIEVDTASSKDDEHEYGDFSNDDEVDVTSSKSIEMAWFIFQEFGILKEKYFIREDTTKMRLLLSNRKEISFENSYADSIFYNFIGYFVNINSYVVEEKNRKKIRYKIINRESGEGIETWDFPKFWHKSIEKYKILPVLSKSNIYTPEQKRGVQLLSTTDNSIKKMLEFEIVSSNPSDIAFVDDNTAILKINYIPEGCPDYGYYKIKFSKKIK